MKLCVETKCLLKRIICPEVVYRYCKGDYQKLAETLIIKKFEPYCWSNPDKIIELWYKWLQNALQESTPKRTAHRALLTHWIIQKTSHYIKCLQTAGRKYPEAHTKVQTLQELMNTSSNVDKIQYEDKLAQRRSTSNLFKYFEAFKNQIYHPKGFTTNSLVILTKIKQIYLQSSFLRFLVNPVQSSFLAIRLLICQF